MKRRKGRRKARAQLAAAGHGRHDRAGGRRRGRRADRPRRPHPAPAPHRRPPPPRNDEHVSARLPSPATRTVASTTSSSGAAGHAAAPATLAPGVPPTLAPAGPSPAPVARSRGSRRQRGPVPPTLPPPGAASAAPSAAHRRAERRAAAGADHRRLRPGPATERGFIALPVALTLSVLPHVRYGDAIARDARAAGKGVMLHLPMEPRSGAYPGPGEVKVAMDDAAIAAQVHDDMASVPLAAGVNNHEGSRATADDRVMRAVSAAIAEHHLFFVDSRTGADSVAARTRRRPGSRPPAATSSSTTSPSWTPPRASCAGPRRWPSSTAARSRSGTRARPRWRRCARSCPSCGATGSTSSWPGTWCGEGV